MMPIERALSAEQRERNFFAAMALLIAATIIAGFGSWALRGMVVHPVPVLVHLHGALFVTWLLIFVGQTLLIRKNSIRTHSHIGMLALAVAGAMLVVGSYTAIESVRLGRVPPFFPPGIFLSLSFLELAAFAALLFAAIFLRRRSDWHRRLMLGAMLSISGPAWGRLLPMADLGPAGGLAVTGAVLVYLAIAAVFDWRHRGKVHPAYIWVAVAIAVEGFATPVLGQSAMFIELARRIATG